jgi:hypothetical protein
MMKELAERASEFYYTKQQIDMLLRACQAKIIELINSLKQVNINKSSHIFEELFGMQIILSDIKNKYLFEFNFNDFLNDFIYFFDRQDEYNVYYLYTHFQQSDEFPS